MESSAKTNPAGDSTCGVGHFGVLGDDDFGTQQPGGLRKEMADWGTDA